jgi:alkylation response protein AidB-like acyl-CoA dehydrogenase
VDFRFTGEERELIDHAGRALAAHLPRGRLLDGVSNQDGWRKVATDGWLHCAIAAADGADAVPTSTLAAIAREAGRNLAHEGFVNNAVLLPNLMLTSGSLRALVDHGHHPGFLVTDGRSDSLTGSLESATPFCFGVEPGMSAYVLTDDNELHRFDSDSWTAEATGRLALDTATVTIRHDAKPAATYEIALGDGLLATAVIVHAAGLVGLGEQALWEAVQHSREREQFGGPIGRFQSLKHALANVAVGLEVAWNSALYAALRPDPTSAAIAHLQAITAAPAAATTMLQVFGGIGMTWEHHAHLLVKVAETSRFRFGDREEFARRIAATDFAPAGGR